MLGSLCCRACGAHLRPEVGHDLCPSCLGVDHLRQGLSDDPCMNCSILPHAVRPARLVGVVEGDQTDGSPSDVCLLFLGAAAQLLGCSCSRCLGDIHLVPGIPPSIPEEIATLLAKGAIEPIDPLTDPGSFYSTYFLVQKKTGGLHPVLDLSHLNVFLKILPFHMLSTMDVVLAFAQGSLRST